MHKKQNKVFVKILKAVSSIVFIVLIGVLVNGYSNQIGLFDTFEVKIKGNKFVTDAQIQKQLQPFISETYFSIKLDEIQSEISLIDFVKCVQVSRILPNTVMVQIIERKPILLITLENENFFIDEENLLLPAQSKAISFYPVPIINISEDVNYNSGLTDEISDLFKFILTDYLEFYENLSEVIISNNNWTFYSDSKTRIFTTAHDLKSQLNILKYFEKTVYPSRELGDYSYIDLRVAKKVVVKEKYHKG